MTAEAQALKPCLETKVQNATVALSNPVVQINVCVGSSLHSIQPIADGAGADLGHLEGCENKWDKIFPSQPIARDFQSNRAFFDGRTPPYASFREDLSLR